MGELVEHPGQRRVDEVIADPDGEKIDEQEERRKKLLAATEAKKRQFERRSQAMQLWEDLTAEGIPGELIALGADLLSMEWMVRVRYRGVSVDTISSKAKKRGMIVETGGLISGVVAKFPREEG